MKRKGLIDFLPSRYIIKYVTVESITTFTLYYKWFIFKKQLYIGNSITKAYSELEKHLKIRKGIK